MNAFMIESKYTPETRERLFREAHALCDRYTPVKRTRRILHRSSVIRGTASGT